MRRFAALAVLCVMLSACGTTTVKLEPKPTEPLPETTVVTEAVTAAQTSETELPAETEETTEVTVAPTEMTGETTLPAASEEATEETTAPEVPAQSYVLNTNTKKFHYLWCTSVSQIKEKNRSDVTGTRDEIISRGYTSCGKCKP